MYMVAVEDDVEHLSVVKLALVYAEQEEPTITEVRGVGRPTACDRTVET